MSAIEIRSASTADLIPARALLIANALPLVGFPDVVALELFPDGALLRSLAVQQDVRGQHLGKQLVAAALDDVRRRDLGVVYLLTTTAESFFTRLGFGIVARDEVPDSLLGSVEFRSACPETATAMARRLD
jgi:amino-acid N-acetyltransferase